jgi:hypothetical protein
MAIPVFGQIHGLSFLVPATTGILRFSKLDKAMRVLAVLCVLACINIGAQLLVGLWGLKNYFVSNFYRIVEVSLFCAVYFFSVGSKAVRNVLKVLAVLFAVIWMVNTIWYLHPDHINSEMGMMSRIFLIVMSVVTLHAAVKDEKSHLLERPVFWVAMGVLLYASGTLLVLGLSNHLLQLGKPYFDVAWHINWSLLIIANLLYTKGMLCKSQA